MERAGTYKFSTFYWLNCMWGHILSLKMEWIFTLFVTQLTPWGVTSICSDHFFWSEYRMNRMRFHSSSSEFHATGVRIEWNSLLNEWNFFTPIDGVNYSLNFFLESRLRFPNLAFYIIKHVKHVRNGHHGLTEVPLEMPPDHDQQNKIEISLCDSTLLTHGQTRS